MTETPEPSESEALHLEERREESRRDHRGQRAYRILIVAIVVAFAVFGWSMWRVNDATSALNDQVSTNHATRIVQDKKFKDELAKLDGELKRLKSVNAHIASDNRDLACATRAFFIQHTPKGQVARNTPFLDFLNSRYHCAGFKLHT
jgi:hypothetical protein